MQDILTNFEFRNQIPGLSTHTARWRTRDSISCILNAPLALCLSKAPSHETSSHRKDPALGPGLFGRLLSGHLYLRDGANFRLPKLPRKRRPERGTFGTSRTTKTVSYLRKMLY